MKIPIVNERDEIIGYKDREDRTPGDTIRITAIWITDENGHILLQQRKLTKKYNPGKWGPAVSGTVEEEETYDSNAVKEMEEEIGLTNIPLEKSQKFYGLSNTGKRFCQLYTAKIPRETKLIPEEDEVENLKWFTKEELKKYLDENPNEFVGLMQDLKFLLNYNEIKI